MNYPTINKFKFSNLPDGFKETIIDIVCKDGSNDNASGINNILEYVQTEVFSYWVDYDDEQEQQKYIINAINKFLIAYENNNISYDTDIVCGCLLAIMYGFMEKEDK